MLQIDPEIVETFEVFVVFDTISVEFPIFFQRLKHNQQRKNELCITFFEENVSAFCLKNTSE